MELSYMPLREQICDICHKMWQLGWVAANDGNVSAVLKDGTLMTTLQGSARASSRRRNWYILTEPVRSWRRKGDIARLPKSRCIFAVMKKEKM